MSDLASTLLSIIDFVGKVFISLVLLRFLLQMVRADFYNPISQFIVKVTHPLLKPLRRIIPSIAGQDAASLVLAYLLQIVIIILMLLVRGVGIPPTPILIKLPVIALIKLLYSIFDVLLFLFIGSAILSWIAPDSRSPASMLIRQICNFILAPLRRFIPPIGIFDITPMIALAILFFFNKLVIRAVSSLGLLLV